MQFFIMHNSIMCYSLIMIKILINEDQCPTCKWKLYGYIRQLRQYIYIYALSRRFYPKRLTITFRLYIFISKCVPWESNPQPFALLTQCSTTEPHRNNKLTYKQNICATTMTTKLLMTITNTFLEVNFYSQFFRSG